MDEPRYKPFHQTYKLITFALSTGCIYPNPKTELMRLLAMPILITTISPLAGMMLTDMYYSWFSRDIVNIIRHSTVVGPFLGGFFKMFLMFHKRVQAKQILDEIDRDYEAYNTMPAEYQPLIASGVRNNLIYSERCWVAVVITCVMTFPAMAIVQNTYNLLFKSQPIKYMIHDLNIPFCEPEIRFESPQFEIMFVYMFYCSILYIVNFIGYDGFFGLSVNHACMKMDLYCKRLEEAFKNNLDNLHGNIVEVIHDQCRMFEYVDLIQDTFNNWLGLIFIATMIQIGTCMYHISEGYGFDLRYTIFVTGAIIHIYLPCRYAAKLKHMSVETSTKIYCCGWESVNDQSVRKMVMFMVARSQKPVVITAFNMLVFDMELFVSIMQTSYSMYTLLTS